MSGKPPDAGGGTAPLPWSPERYARHAEARLRPALDLLARIEAGTIGSIVDLGCGAGALFPALRARFPNAAITGVDASPAMLAKAREVDQQAVLVEADAARWRPAAPVDLILANAVLHWLPDHARLLPDLMAHARTLAVQIPNNFAAASHRLMRELMAEPSWHPRLARVQLGEHVLPAEAYHDLLRPLCRRLDLWETVYYHTLTGADPVLDWLKGTALLPIHKALGGPETAEAGTFDRLLAARLAAAYPANAAGVTLFPFRRLLFVAVGRTP